MTHAWHDVCIGPEHFGELVEHGFREISRFFADYKRLEGKAVEVGEVADPDAAVETIKHAMEIYGEKFPREVS